MTQCQNCLRLEAEVAQLKERLRKKDEELSIDALTGINNRHFLNIFAPDVVQERRAQHPTWGVLMIDIDFFKKFNDRYGHPFGDLVLKNVAQMLKEVSRRGDVVIRYGGEEFCVIVSGVSEANLHKAAERYRKSIEALKSCYKVTSECVSVTISIGACFVPSDSGATLEELIDFADEALYSAKDAGRNKVVVYADRRKNNRHEQKNIK